MARIRGLICGHIGMIELIKALLVALDLGFARKPQHFHTLHILYLSVTCILLLLVFLAFHHLFTQTEHYHYIPLIVTYTTLLTLSISCHIHLSYTHLTHYLGIGKPTDPPLERQPHS